MEQKTYGLGSQQDGDHYLKMRLQPIDLAYRLGATPCFCKLAKYLTRDKGDKLMNLQKARHCVTLEMDLQYHVSEYYYVNPYPIEGYGWIEEFSDDLLIQNALTFMLIQDYKGCLNVVDQIISRYLESL